MYLIAAVTELLKGLFACDFGSYRCWLSNDGESVAAFLVPLAVLSLVRWQRHGCMVHLSHT